ncbi:transposable element Tcb1 transposase [Trichonephila clavipes]|nr:transposable element Tcb1 transposase [Trichonephila clavipes]
MDTSSACRESEPRSAEDPSCRGGRCTLNMSRHKRPPVGVMWKLREDHQMRDVGSENGNSNDLGQDNGTKLLNYCIAIGPGQRSAFDQVSEFDRGWIVAYRDYGLSFRKIGSRVGRNQTTAMRMCDRWMQEGTTDRHGRPHPPQCTTSREDR